MHDPLLGWPSINVPAGFTYGGLPIGDRVDAFAAGQHLDDLVVVVVD